MIIVNLISDHLVIISDSAFEIGHDAVVNKPRVSPPDAVIRRPVAHVLQLVPAHTCGRHVIQSVLSRAVFHGALIAVRGHEHDAHLVEAVGVG